MVDPRNFVGEPNHDGPPEPPAGWLQPGDEGRNPPKHIPAITLGAVTLAKTQSYEIGIERALTHFFAPGVDFPPASTNFSDANNTDFGHPFLRDVAYSLMLLQPTEWLKQIHRVDAVERFLLAAYSYQGKQDVPNVVKPWANDGEKRGRHMHEHFPDAATNPVAQKLNREKGWQLPTYSGAVDTSPLAAMMTATEGKTNPGLYLRNVVRSHNDGTTSRITMLEGYVQTVEHILGECRVTEDNPEGLYETALMSNQTDGDWTDSPEAPRDRRGQVAKGRIAHTQLQAYASSAAKSLIDLVEDLPLRMNEAIDRLRMDPADTASQRAVDACLDLEGALTAAGLVPGAPLIEECRQTASRLDRALTDLFLIEDDPTYGTYFALGLDRDPETKALRKLDACSPKPGLMLLVDKDHLPSGIAEVVIRQIMDPQSGLLYDNGVSNLSQKDDFFDPRVYHQTGWPHIAQLIVEGMERHGAPALANELSERNWQNFIDPWERGFHEFRPAVPGRPTLVQENWMATARNDNGDEFEHSFIKEAQGGQFWALAAAANHANRMETAWHPDSCNRATDPKMRAVEDEVMVAIKADGHLLTAALYHRDDADRYAEQIQVSADGTVTVNPEGAVTLAGQRMPGEIAKGRNPPGATLA